MIEQLWGYSAQKKQREFQATLAPQFPSQADLGSSCRPMDAAQGLQRELESAKDPCNRKIVLAKAVVLLKAVVLASRITAVPSVVHP